MTVQVEIHNNDPANIGIDVKVGAPPTGNGGDQSAEIARLTAANALLQSKIDKANPEIQLDIDHDNARTVGVAAKTILSAIKGQKPGVQQKINAALAEVQLDIDHDNARASGVAAKAALQ